MHNDEEPSLPSSAYKYGHLRVNWKELKPEKNDELEELLASEGLVVEAAEELTAEAPAAGDVVDDAHRRETVQFFLDGLLSCGSPDDRDSRTDDDIDALEPLGVEEAGTKSPSFGTLSSDESLESPLLTHATADATSDSPGSKHSNSAEQLILYYPSPNEQSSGGARGDEVRTLLLFCAFVLSCHFELKLFTNNESRDRH